MECDLGNITVHYEQRGEGRPVLALHGASLDHRHIMNDLDPLFEGRDGWRRIYPDLPGHGRTPGPDWLTSQDQVLDIVLGLTDHVAPGERFVLAGESWGGMIARGMLYRRQEMIDGLCLIVTPLLVADARSHPVPHAIVEDPELIEEAAQVDPQAGEVMRFQPVQTREVLDWWIDNSRPAKDLLDWGFYDRMIGKQENLAFSFDVNVLPMPFVAPGLLLWGRQERTELGDAARIIADYPRTTVAMLDRAGHLAMVHQRKLFNALVGEWLDRVEEYVGR